MKVSADKNNNMQTMGTNKLGISSTFFSLASIIKLVSAENSLEVVNLETQHLQGNARYTAGMKVNCNRRIKGMFVNNISGVSISRYAKHLGNV